MTWLLAHTSTVAGRLLAFFLRKGVLAVEAIQVANPPVDKLPASLLDSPSVTGPAAKPPGCVELPLALVHPDPAVARRSGRLTPSPRRLSLSSALGRKVPSGVILYVETQLESAERNSNEMSAPRE